ncbi:MAG: hypothetical protein REI78_02695 [Pedobacter sp.]|nr:hypothetical protein [Pedobacter sp.]
MAITTAEHFQIDYKEHALEVTESKLGSQRIFHIRFPDGKKMLVLTVGESKEGVKFWTSVPPNRLSEAKEIGPIIARYFRDKKNS